MESAMAEPSYEELKERVTELERKPWREKKPRRNSATRHARPVLSQDPDLRPGELKRIGEQDVDVAPIINQFQQSRETNT
jgi:hypothetical protein